MVAFEFGAKSLRDPFMVAFLCQQFEMLPPFKHLVLSGYAVVQDGEVDPVAEVLMDFGEA
ncbi:MAG: hypothetical protein DI563_05670 [Variovorax paradoxus]|uniref:Uncharacterized protein n=1 Tax=Variovorax paradoxus TaxID=34073 RepID=A0A2W5QIJ5_VARPD|nr:MAG: hypothetical protein DI563_05670 [Variovorax paradoxus]